MKQDEFLVPFWERKREQSGGFGGNRNLKKLFLGLKIVFYCFSGLMIFWSFIQSMFSSYTNYHPNPGTGLEFGFLPGSLPGSDPKFELGSWSIAGPKYHAFYEPSWVYGPFLSWFVYPVARVFLLLIYAFSKSGTFLSKNGLDVIFAMIIVMFAMRFINFWPTLRSSIYAEKQVEHQSALDAISAKFDKLDSSDRDIKLQKHQEISAYNRKHKLKPFAALENFFISTPIFLIIFKVITISRPIKFTNLFNLWDLSKTPSNMIFNYLTDPTERGWLYLVLCLVIIPVNLFSQKISAILSKKRNPKLNKNIQNKNSQAYKVARIQKIMTFIFLAFTFFWSTSLAIYYFFNSIFTIFQNLLIHQILVHKKKNVNSAQLKLQKLGIDA